MVDIYDKIFSKIKELGGEVMLKELENNMDFSSAIIRKRVLDLQHSHVLESASVGTSKKIKIINNLESFRDNKFEPRIDIADFLRLSE